MVKGKRKSPKRDKCAGKTCPKEKICNPASGRCVLKSGAVGKKLLRKSPKRKSPKRKSPKRKSPKRKSKNLDKCKGVKCPKTKICNPATGNCVLRRGAIGKKILKMMKGSPKRKPRKSPKNKCDGVICSEHQICNPESGRCVLKKGKIGQRILGKKKSPKRKKKSPKRKKKSPKRKKKSPKRKKNSPKRKKSPKKKSPKRKKKSPKKKSPKRKERSFKEIQLEKRKGCKNEDTIFTIEPTNELKPNDLYVSPSGYCYDINNELVPTLLSSKNPNSDPFDRQPLWNVLKEKDAMKGEISFEKSIYKHPGLTSENALKLKRKFLTPPGLPKETTELILKYHKVFNEFGLLGITMWSDYSKGFISSTNALGKFNEMLEKIPADDKRKLLSLKSRDKSANSMKHLLESYNSSCLHGVGHKIMAFYLSYKHELCEKKTPEIEKLICNHHIQGYIKADSNRATIVSFIIPEKLVDVSIYLHDDETRGMNSKFYRAYELRYSRDQQNYIHGMKKAPGIWDRLREERDEMVYDNTMQKIKSMAQSGDLLINSAISEGSESGWENAI